MTRHARWGVVITAGVVLVGAAVQIVTNYATPLAPGWLRDPWHVWTVLVGLVFLLVILSLVTQHWRAEPETFQPAASQLGEARKSLAERVRVQWREEERIRALGDPTPMPVRWKLTERALADHPQLIAPGRLAFTGRSDRIDAVVEQFNALSRRRLVILGDPGSGKTTLAVQLLLRLLDTRADTDPVPVLLTLASWDLAAHPRLGDWLISRLGADYPALRAFGAAIPRALVDQSMILPVLDGLDELPEAYRPQVLHALNTSLGTTDPMVVTCRTDDYTAAVVASDVLTAAAVIEPEDLTAANAADYLTSCLRPNPGQPWQAVLGALRQGTAAPLATVCATPLGLWLLRTVYITGGGDPGPLVTDSRLYPAQQRYKPASSRN